MYLFCFGRRNLLRVAINGDVYAVLGGMQSRDIIGQCSQFNKHMHRETFTAKRMQSDAASFDDLIFGNLFAIDSWACSICLRVMDV